MSTNSRFGFEWIWMSRKRNFYPGNCLVSKDNNDFSGLQKSLLPLTCPLKCPYDSIRIHNKGTLWAKLCNLMRSYVFLCVRILLYAFLCVPMSYYAFLCFPMCSYVILVKCSLYSCLLIYGRQLRAIHATLIF